MRRVVRDMVWILLLAGVALIGIRVLSRQIQSARSISETNPLALIAESPQAVLCLHQPQTLQLMLPSLPAIQRLLQAYLPKSPLYRTEQLDETPPFTLVYYPSGEVWIATLTEREAKRLWEQLDDGHPFAAQRKTELTLPVRYYPEPNKRFLGCYYYQGIFVASYNRQLLRETIQQQLRLRPVNPIATNLQALAPSATTAPLRLLLPADALFPEETVREATSANGWLSLPFFFNEGNLCCSHAWPLPNAIPDSLLERTWLQPLSDSLSLRLRNRLPGVETTLQATIDEQAADVSIRAP